MPEITGAWAPNSSTNQRIRLRAVYAVATTATQATITLEQWLDTRYGVTDVNNVHSWSGAFGSGSGSVSINLPTDGSMMLRRHTLTVALKPEQQSLPFSASLSGVEYVGATATLSGSVIVPAQQATKPPAAPASTRALRRSDTEHEIGWNPVNGALSYRVLRREMSQTSWETIAQVAGSSSAIIDRSTKADGRYRWAIRAVNGAGESDSALTRFLRTSPAPPTGVTVVGRTAEGVEITWTASARYADEQVIEISKRATAGGSWGDWSPVSGIGALGPSVTSALIPEAAMAGAAETRLRVRAHVTQETDATLASWSAASAPVKPLAPPSAPTLLTAWDMEAAGEPIGFGWQHRPVDGSTENAGQMEIRPVGGSSTLYSAIGEHSLTLDAGEYEWRARTRGQHPDFGPWSPYRRFTVAERPGVEIITPEPGTWPASRLPVEIAAADASGASILRITATLLDASGRSIDRMLLTPKDGRASGTFGTSLENGASYTLTASAYSGTGLTSQLVSRTLVVDFAPPPTPTLTVDWIDESATASLAISNPAPGAWDAVVGTWGDQDGTWENLATGGVAATHNRIERSTDGGQTWQQIADDLPLNAGWLDWSAPLGGEILYRALAVSADGAAAESSPVAAPAQCGVVVLTSPSGDWWSLEYNLSLSHDLGRTTATHHYLGDEWPTAHYGEPRTERVTIAALEIREQGEPPLPSPAAWLDGDVWYRDPEGRAWWATLDGSLSAQADSNRSRQVAFTATRIERPEGAPW